MKVETATLRDFQSISRVLCEPYLTHKESVASYSVTTVIPPAKRSVSNYAADTQVGLI